jgi:TonB family protein
MYISILMALSLSLLSILSQTSQLSLEKRAIADTQQSLASTLDSGLPDISFADWHEKVVGKKAGVVWQLSECGEKAETTVNGTADPRACVEVNTLLSDGRRVILMIAVGTFKKGITGRPTYQFGVIQRDSELRPIRRLSDLQTLLSAAGELPKKPSVVLPELDTPSISLATNNIYLSVAALGNVEEIGWPIEMEEPPPEPPPNQPRNSPLAQRRPQSLQQLAEEVLDGNAITRVEPTYPPTARMMKAMGVVKVQITISETGGVIEAKAISGHQALRAAAVDAANKWVFKPTTVDGVPIKVQGVLTFNFRSKIQRED